MDLPYPGGPHVEKLAQQGDPYRFDLPIPFKNLNKNNQSHNNSNFDVKADWVKMSFSGLKTAVRQIFEKKMIQSHQDACDLSASFERCISLILELSLKRALEKTTIKHSQVVLSGGVASNYAIRSHFLTFCQLFDLKLTIPPAHLCTDNAAMIAWCGLEHFIRKTTASDLFITPIPRWNIAS
jgi:N6-L-threonylcarbamoyladenine synthase